MTGRYEAYPEYKNTAIDWLGNVPSHWTVARLKNTLRIKNGRDYKDVEVSTDGYPVYGSGGIFKRSSDYLYEGESVLFGRKGTVDKPLLVDGKFWTVDTMFYSEIAPKMDARFIHNQAMLFPYKLLSTNTALPSMTQEDLLELGFVYPSFEEQQKIANFLDHETAKIDTLITKQEKLIELLKEKRQAVISHAVTKGISNKEHPDAPVRMKDSGVEWLGEVPEHWAVVRLRFLCEITTGSRDTQDAKDNGQYPFFVRSDNIQSIDTYSFDGEGVMTSGDGAGVGKIFHHFIGKCEIHQRVYLFHKFRLITPRYFYHYLKQNLEPIALAQSAKSTVDSLRLPILQEFSMCFGNEAEQNEICQYVDSLSEKYAALIQSANKAIELMKERKTALISAAVTGKIDVRDWEKDN